MVRPLVCVTNVANTYRIIITGSDDSTLCMGDGSTEHEKAELTALPFFFDTISLFWITG